ncbi:hypothetical protein BsWGS_06174 [Bradybaena similaris]
MPGIWAGLLPRIPKGIGYTKAIIRDHPDIACCFGLLTIGGLSLIYLVRNYDRDIQHQHKFAYTVIREEDADPIAKEKCVYN